MDEKMVSLRINDIPVTVPEGSTVLEAARSAGFNIPSLCFLKDINEIGACRICVVEVKGAKSLVASCVYPVAEGMEVYTNTERVRKSRQLTLELILSNHRMDCLTCSRNSHCELLQLAGDLGIDAVRYANDNMPPQIEASAPHLVRDNSKCVLCRRCTAVCRKTQEVGRMITQAGLLFEHLPDGAFDPMLGVSTGAAAIFGASGGVMEAALRTVVEQLTGAGMAPLEYQEVRGMEGVKEASYELPGKTVRVCVASGLHNVKRVLDGIRDGSLQYDFVEFMACPGGCINGGGQPIQHANVRNFTDIKALRAAALYKQDEGMTYRRSHENPVVQKVYADFLGEPGGHKAHALLHCSYIKQKRYRV